MRGGVNHVVVGHDESWINFFKKSFALSKNTAIQIFGSEKTAYKDDKVNKKTLLLLTEWILLASLTDAHGEGFKQCTERPLNIVRRGCLTAQGECVTQETVNVAD